MIEDVMKIDKCPRIFGVNLGDNANPYFLKYLASISRGKCIHLTDAGNVYPELIAFFNEFRSPICMDLSMNVVFKDEKRKFNEDLMLFPYPIGDTYNAQPLLIKVEIATEDISQIVVYGRVKDEKSTKEINIEILIKNDDNNNNHFPMELLLARSHLDCLHAKIWHYGNKSINSSDLLVRANEISGLTGLASPTCFIQCVEEPIEKNEKKLDSLALPERTGRGARRKTGTGSKGRIAAMAATVSLGSIAVVTVLNPFGEDEGILGGIGDAAGQIGGCCGDDGCDGCECDGVCTCVIM